MGRFWALILFTLSSSAVNATILYEWADSFTPREQAKLTAWMTRTANGLTTLTGPLPFDVHIRFHRSASKEPVPWANTRRGRRQGVNFHVDPSFSLDRFLADWTAPHELSHLAIPHLGRRHAWFAEGFASYMQYQVMHQMGIADWEDIIGRYKERMAKAKRGYDFDHLTFADAAPRLRARGSYPTMYWGGAVLFLRADDRLRREADRSLVTVLAEYVACCRLRTRDVHSLIRSLDEVSGSRIFSEEFKRFTEESGFPEFETALEGLDRQGGGALGK